MKAEFLYQYQETNGYSFRSKLFAKSTNFNKIASKVPKLYNAISQNKITASFIKKITGVHHKRDLPRVSKSLSSFIKFNSQIENRKVSVENPIKKVFLYIDEFTNYLDTEIGKDALILLDSLNYEVFPVHHLESGRTYISKGFLKDAVKITNQNINFFKDLITDDSPLIGIEPSAILTFRDEYIRLADDKVSAEKIAKNTFTFEEFLAKELENENIDTSLFTSVPKTLKVHGHCHQKALSGTFSSFQMLSIPDNYAVTILNTGCCGMAGSFGYEKEHYEVSMQVGEDTLFPKVRNCSINTEIAAAGTSCRHQIFDGTKRIAKHPITLLKEALL
jgi:Fe-S oxidoreductase